MPELAFVLAPRQNLFFDELVRALARELEAQGVATSVHSGAFPPPRPGLVYAVVPPHEYFTLMHGRIGLPPDVYARTIFICAEQPGTPFFEWNVDYAHNAGAVFDINRDAVEQLRRAGIPARHLQLGWTQEWDHLDWERERDIDVLFMGAATPRRIEVLGSLAPALWHRRCHFVISDNSRPNWQSSGSYLSDERKWDLLARSKVLVNVHQEDRPYFEWLRLAQAMSSGCVVVTEHSLDFAPLRAGEHFQAGRPESLGFLVDHLLEDPHERWLIQREAYGMVKEVIPLREAVRGLTEAVHELDGRPVPDAATAFFRQPPPARADVERALARIAAPPPDDGGAVARALKDVKLDLIDLRRRLDRIARADEQLPETRVHRVSAGWRAMKPRVTVLLSLFNYGEYIEGALDSLTRSTMHDWEVVIVDDGSTDESLERAERWIAAHETAAAMIVRHTFNRGLGAARNTALAFARGEYSFVLDADNEILPDCFSLLIAGIEADPGAAFCYGVLERFTIRGSVGLLNYFPWDPGRFMRDGNYIDAMALMRTDRLREVGGYRLDRRLHGWEDFDLWVRMAERGWHAAHVPSLVARYRDTDHSMLSVTNISGAEARSIIAEAAPTLHASAAAR